MSIIIRYTNRRIILTAFNSKKKKCFINFFYKISFLLKTSVLLGNLCYVDYFVVFYSNVYNIVYNNVDNTICFTGHLPGISCILTCFF